jgi:signal peptidase II
VTRGPVAARRLAAVLVAASTVVGCDQASKTIARATLEGTGRRSYLADTVRLELVLNRGAFLGLGEEWDQTARFWMFVVGPAAALAGLAVVAVRARRPKAPELLAWSLLLGGGASNLADRVISRGAVTDFLNVGVGPLRTGVFNVADVAITAGALALLLGAGGDRGVHRNEPGA